MSAASVGVHDQTGQQFIHIQSVIFEVGLLFRCTIYHVLSLCVRCMPPQNMQSDISHELYILSQCLLHISVIPSLRSFPSLPGAQFLSFLLTLYVYTVLIIDLAIRSNTINHKVYV